jgi:ribosomal protein S18 acetylase RimI-like enzyme
MGLAVRQASANDVQTLLPMMADFNRFEGIPWSPVTGEAPLRRLLSDPSLGVVGLAEATGAVCGYFVLTWGYDLEWNGRDAFLTELWLTEAARGHGHGQALLEAAEDTARSHGAKALHLMVRHENTRALALYRRAGYASPPRDFLSKVLVHD